MSDPRNREYPLNSVDCFGCGKRLSSCTGCPRRIEICEDCRLIPKKFKRARQVMELHLRRHEIAWAREEVEQRRKAAADIKERENDRRDSSARTDPNAATACPVSA